MFMVLLRAFPPERSWSGRPAGRSRSNRSRPTSRRAISAKALDPCYPAAGERTPMAARRAAVAVILGGVLLSAPARAVELFSVAFSSYGLSREIPARLIKPDGAGPFPAIVIMHDC